MGALANWALKAFETERRWLLLVLAYLCMAAAIRLAGGGALGRDDVEAAILAQDWALGYRADQPPLHTWLLAAYQTVFGRGLLAHTLLRFDLLGLTFLFLFLSGRAAGLTTRNAGLAALVPVLSILFGWQALDLYTHSLALSATMALALWMLMRYRRSGALSDAAGLGLALGLMLLSKYAALPMIAALAGAAAGIARRSTAERGRRRWPGLLLIAAAATLVVAPFGYWAMTQSATLIAASGESLGMAAPLPYWDRLLSGGGALGQALFNAAAAPAAILLLIAPGIIRPMPLPLSGPLGENRRIIEHTVVLTLLIYGLSVVTLGADGFRTHHLIAPLLWLPVAVFLRIQERGADQTRSLRWCALAIAVVMTVGTIAFGAKVFAEVRLTECRRCYLTRPMDAIALALSQRGFVGGTILTEQQLLAGGLVPFLPAGTRVSTAVYPDLPVPARDREEKAGQCLLAWESRGSIVQDREVADTLLAYAAERFAADSRPGEIQIVSRPFRHGGDSPRRFSVSYMLYAGMGKCR